MEYRSRTMPQPTVGVERVNAFRIGETYYLRHYFESESVSDRLRRFYDNHHYRFEIPIEEFDSVRAFLQEYGYRLRPVVSLEDYIVTVRKYTAHPDNIFKESVYMWDAADYHCFLLAHEDAVAYARSNGASRLRNVTVDPLSDHEARTGQTRLQA